VGGVKRVIVRLLIVAVAFLVVNRIKELDPRNW
jgi:hypothetical protein